MNNPIPETRAGRAGLPQLFQTIACIALATAALLGASGCGKKSPPPPPVMDIQVGNRSELEDLDPHVCSGVAEFRALGALFEGLVTLDPESLEPIPGVAERWEVSTDGLQYTFNLRENARWSNGEPVTANDFVYAWQRMLTPTLASEYAYMLHCIKGGKAFNEGTLEDFSQVGVSAVDTRTLVVTLETPTPYFLSMQVHFAWFPVNQKVIEAHGTMDQRGSAWTRAGNHVGNGPFKLDHWRPDETLRVIRNEHYWDAANVKSDAVTFHPISNEQTEERTFRARLLHLTYTVPMHKIASYKEERPETLFLEPYLQTYFYRFNMSKPPFNDPRVRRAFSMSIDREAIARNVLKAGERPAYHLTPQKIAGYTSEFRVDYDPEGARRLLAEAGFPEGAGFPQVELLYNSSEFDKTMSEAMQAMWGEALGVQVLLMNQDYKVYLASMTALDYDIARSTWLADVVDPINFLECFLGGQGNNRTGYASQDFDALIHAAYRERDPVRRETHLQAAEKRLLEDAPIAPVCFMTQKYLKAPELKGLRTNPLGYIRWQELYLEQTN